MKKLVSTLIVIFMLLLTGLPFGTVGLEQSNKTIYVDDDGTADYTTIKEAVENASEGDTIFVYSGNYDENVIKINKSISLIGEDKHSTIVQNFNRSLIFSIRNCNVTIKGFTFMHKDKNPYDDFLYHGLFECHSSNVIITDNIFLNTSRGIVINTYSKHDYFIVQNNTFLNNFYGILDSGGESFANFDTNGTVPGMIGYTISFAYPLQGSPWDFASNPINIIISQ